MKKTIKILSIVILSLLSACNNSISTNNDDKINQRIATLENEVTELKNSLDSIKNNDLLELRENIFKINIENDFKKIAIFTPSDKDFQVLTTDEGILLISLKNIEEYADGYKITFSIGNPSTVTYSRVDIELTYGPKLKDSNIMDDKQSVTYKTTLTQDLMPGYWNDIQLILSNTKKEQLNYIWVSISPKTVELNILPPKIN